MSFLREIIDPALVELQLTDTSEQWTNIVSLALENMLYVLHRRSQVQSNVGNNGRTIGLFLETTGMV